MTLNLHANATTTPKTRGYIQSSTAGTRTLARELGVTLSTIHRWRRRVDVMDRVPLFGLRTAYVKQAAHDRLIEYGEDCRKSETCSGA